MVGIFLDQMRHDYFTHSQDKFGKDGFNRLLSEGCNCKHNHFNYIVTYIAP